MLKSRKSRVAPACVVAAIGALLLSACGSSDQTTASKSAQEIVAASRTAVQKASSVHIVSSAQQGPVSFALDMRLTRDGGRSKVTLDGVSVEVIRTGETIYLKAEKGTYQRLGITQTVPPGQWVQLPAGPRLRQIVSFTDLGTQVPRMFPAAKPVTKGHTTTVHGEPAIELKATGQLYKGTLYVKTSGEPYPLRLEKQGRENAQTAFSGWNATSPPAAPTNVVKFAG
jgi:hypothetical protein